MTGRTGDEINQSILKAEEYLVQVISKVQCKTFNELRCREYQNAKVLSSDDLQPNSGLVLDHIKRAFLVTNMNVNILTLNCDPLDPTEFGYTTGEGYLKPRQEEIIYPPITDLPPPCTCKKCSRQICRCVANNLPCIDLCSCKMHNTCVRR